MRGLSRGDLYQDFAREGSHFARLCTRYLDLEHDVFFGFSSASLECIESENAHGIRTVLDQIDPARSGERILEEERRRFPELSEGEETIPEAYFDRLEREWQAASVVIVNSLWSQRALIDQGVLPGEKAREFVLNRKTEEEYLSACQEPLRSVATLILDTGLRAGEALALERSDVDLDRGAIHGRKGKSKKGTPDLGTRASQLGSSRGDAS